MRYHLGIIIGLLLAILGLVVLNLLMGDVAIAPAEVWKILKGGSVDNASWSYIIENRLNRSIVGIGAGGALAVAGLILQAFFRNPLAGPGVLGITSGASLGVALVLLSGFGLGTLWANVGIVLAGMIGAGAVLALLLIVARFIRNSVTLLIAGLMFGYFTSALIDILLLWSEDQQNRAYIVWGQGSFDGLSNAQMLIFWLLIAIGVLSCVFLIKTLNALAMGEDYALSVGINIKRSKVIIILITGILAAVVTVYCGPISFVGIAVPQLIRLLIKSANHKLLFPLSFLGGSCLALLADTVVRLSGSALPLNTVTALAGAPVIIWIIVKMNRSDVKI